MDVDDAAMGTLCYSIFPRWYLYSTRDIQGPGCESWRCQKGTLFF